MSFIRSLTLIVLVGTVMAGEATTTPLTLADAVAASQSEHPDAAVALARLAEAQAKLRQANAALLPRLTVGSSYTITNQPAMAFMGLINHGAYTSSINANDPPTVDNLNLGANIQVPLFTPGTWSGRIAAQHGATAARAAQDAARNALTLTTVQAFIGVHQAKAHVTGTMATLRAGEANLASARTRNQNGSLSKADLLGLEAMLAGIRSEVAASNGGLELAGQALATALGREGSITDIAAMPAVPLPEPIAIGDKPELTVVREQSAAAKASVDQARAQHLPRVGAFGGVDYDRGFKQDGEGQSWNVGVGIQWTLFAGGGTEAGVDVAEATQRVARAELRRATLQIAQGRAAAHTRYTTIVAQLAATTAQQLAAEEAERLQAERFAAGAATTADLAVAEGVLAQARAAIADAEAGLRMTIAELRWQYGLPILP